MNYDEFRVTLEEEIQANVSKTINFMETTSTKVNEILKGIALRLDGESVAPVIYPRQLYADYRAGIPISTIASSVSDILSDTADYPAIPQITPENAQKYISFALINKEKNKELLATCPYREVLDMAAVPRWYMDKGSFLVNYNVMQMLQMTKEEVLDIASRNTESKKYVCKDINSIIRDALTADGMEAELLDDLCPAREPLLYVLSNKTNIDGSCAVLSDRFMQSVSEKLGTDEVYLLPSSRDEMLAVNPAIAGDVTQLKDIVLSVNNNPEAIQPDQVLSDSVYCYNATTHALSLCDGMGLAHAEQAQTVKQTISRGRGRI